MVSTSDSDHHATLTNTNNGAASATLALPATDLHQYDSANSLETASVQQPQKSQPENSTLASTSRDGRNVLSMDNNQTGNVASNNNIKLKLQISGAGQYEITVPNSDVYNITASNLDPAHGTLTRTVANGNTIFKIDVTYDGVMNIPILINTNSNYERKATPMPTVGTTERTINWSVNGEAQTPLTFYQTIKPEWDPQQPTRTNPNPNQVKGVQVRSNVTYTLNLNETPGVENETQGVEGDQGCPASRVNSAVNYGTVITIPVPAGFKLDEAATMTLNNFGDQTQIKQAGGAGTDITITVPKGSGNQGWQFEAGYQLVGQYDIDQPEHDLHVSTDQLITIVQRLADGTTKEATVPSFTDTIIGKNTDVPQGTFYLGANTAYGNKQIPKDNNEIVVNYFGLQNSTIYAYDVNNKLDIKLTFPDGLTVNKITVPVNATNLPGTTSYSYTMTLINGQTMTGEVAAGQSVGTDSSIQSITFTPNLWAIGAQTNSLPNNDIDSQNTTVSAFIAYGHVNQSYDNGSAVKTGDELTSTMQLTAGNLGGLVTATQKVYLPEDGVASETVYQWQNSQIRGVQGAGYISVYRGVQGASTTNQIFEPIFYYVLPGSTVPKSPLELVTPNTATVHPQVTEFAVEGRTIVKVDYTGTGYNFITTLDNNNNQVYLDNQADATKGIYPWDIYVISSKTPMTNPKYGETTANNFSTTPATNPFNPAWVENQTDNLYHLGGGNWTINQVSAVTSQVMVKGNENAGFGSTGMSNDKKSPEMQIGISIINGTDDVLNNANAYLSVPNTTNGSGFNFQLSDQPTLAQLPNSTVPNYTITYSTADHDIYSSEPDEEFVTAGQVTDWSKIKTIKISIPHIGGYDVLGRLILTGQDPTFAEDAGKSGAVKTTLYAPGFVTYTNAKHPVTIAIEGSSTITSRYSYVDDNGDAQTVNIPDRTYTYRDNTDHMLTKEQALAKLTAADKVLIPEGYILDGNVELLPPTVKSWQTDAPIGTPEFGGGVKYFYNNAVIQYQLVKQHTGAVQTKDVTRTVHYVDKTTGQPMPSSLVPTVQQKVTLTQYVVKDSSGNVIGYNTTGTWDGDTYTPSTEAYGQIKVDTTDVTASWMNPNNQKWALVNTPHLKQHGYSGPLSADGGTFNSSQVAEVIPTGATSDTAVTVYYSEDTVEVTPDRPQEPETTIPGYSEKFPAGVTENDLNKTITRTIHVYDSDGNLIDTLTQPVKYTRTATVNVVTKAVTYSDWTSTNDKWSGYIPTLTIGQSIRAITDYRGNAYDDVTTNTEGQLSGVNEVTIPASDTDQDSVTVNIRLEKTVSFTGYRDITYNTYDRDGQLISTVVDNSQTVSVTGHKYYDPVAGHVIYEFDPASGTYGSVNVPIKTGYYASAKTVPTATVTINSNNPQDSDLNASATVDYHPMGQVLQVDQDGNPIPGTTPVTYPNDPHDPTKAGEVKVPDAPDGWVTENPSDSDPFIPTDPGQDTEVPYKKVVPPDDDPRSGESIPSHGHENGPIANSQSMTNSHSGQAVAHNKVAQNKHLLPQTGNADNLAMMGLGAATLLSMFGLAGLDKKRGK